MQGEVLELAIENVAFCSEAWILIKPFLLRYLNSFSLNIAT